MKTRNYRERMIVKTARCAVALFCTLAFPVQGSDAQKPGSGNTHKASGILQPFHYQDVVLTGGPMGIQAAGAHDFYLALSEDNLLNGFRKRAGLPAPGKPMGGWYDPDGFAGGHPFGQYVSALSRMYANTGDVRFKEKVARLVHGFHETLASDGYFYMSEKVSREWPNYLYDKNCIGMRDAYTLTGDKEALVVLNKMTDWAVNNLPRRKDEWYTLPENLYNCYALTKDERYLRMAKEYDYSKEYYDPFANGINAFTPDRHAYSHVNTLASAAKAYEVTGDEKYFKAIENAWTFLTTTQMYASGGWGPLERFVTPGQGKLAESIENNDSHFEPIAPETPDTRAALYGPLLLVALSEKPVQMKGDHGRIDAVKRPGSLPAFHTHGGSIGFLPLYQVKNESYTTYLRLSR